ncbi:MAG: hypothetical protein K6A63_02220 [Acholeplasmatales bacterium]|nr:hypothetical protein [Acholeplasmatales bacterium]
MGSVTIKIQEGFNNQNGEQNNYYAPQSNASGSNSGVSSTLKSVGAMKLVNAATNATTSMIKFSLSNYGDFTGDYLAQEKINNTLAMLNTAMSFGSNIVGGAMVAGVPGAIVGGIVSGIQLGTTLAQNIISANLSAAKSNYAAQANANRLGRILVSGGR